MKYSHHLLYKIMTKGLVPVLLLAFISTNLPLIDAQAQSITALSLMTAPGKSVSLTSPFDLAYLKGMVIDANDPFKLDFIVYRGDKHLSDQVKREQYNKLIKYFLAAMAVPDTEQWVNLSPYEKDKTIPKDFGLTEMGRDLLAQDYLLKQLSSSLNNPNTYLGKKFWNEVYSRAYKELGTTNIPVSTFNKVWIVPDKAQIYEKGNTVYIVSDHLKVMTDEDYLSMKKHGMQENSGRKNEVMKLSNQVMREIIIPAIEKEANEGRNFAPLRQVFSGMLLATWYKKALRESILSKLYANSRKVKGVDQDPRNNVRIYNQYLRAFKKGVFNMIKEDVDPSTNEVVARKYFSGGISNKFGNVMQDVGYAMMARDYNGRISLLDYVKSIMISPVARAFNAAVRRLPKISIAGITLVASLSHNAAANDQINFRDTNPDAVSHTLSYGPKSGGPYATTVTSATESSFTIPELPAGQENFFVLQGLSSQGDVVDSSNEFSWVPPTVLGISNSGFANGQATLNFAWAGQSLTKTNLNLLVAGDMNGPWTTETNYTLAQNGDTYSITIPTTNNTMFMRLGTNLVAPVTSFKASGTLNVTSVGAGTKGALSPVSTGKKTTPTKMAMAQVQTQVPLSNPNNLNYNLNGYVQLAWNGSPGAVGYYVYFSPNGAVTNFTPATRFDAGNALSINVGGVLPGQANYYAASAYMIDGNGNRVESALSQWVSTVANPVVNTIYPSSPSGQVQTFFAWGGQPLVSSNVTVQVAYQPTGTNAINWYSLRQGQNYAFANDEDGTYSINIPYSSYPGGILLVNVLVSNPAPSVSTIYPTDPNGQILYSFINQSKNPFNVDVSVPGGQLFQTGNFGVLPTDFYSYSNDNVTTIALPQSSFPTNTQVTIPQTYSAAGSVTNTNGIPLLGLQNTGTNIAGAFSWVGENLFADDVSLNYQTPGGPVVNVPSTSVQFQTTALNTYSISYNGTLPAGTTAWAVVKEIPIPLPTVITNGQIVFSFLSPQQPLTSSSQVWITYNPTGTWYHVNTTINHNATTGIYTVYEPVSGFPTNNTLYLSIDPAQISAKTRGKPILSMVRAAQLMNRSIREAHATLRRSVQAAVGTIDRNLRGGIDFSLSTLDMDIKRDGQGVPLPVSQQNLENINLVGLTPVILDIEPAQGIALPT